MKKVLSLSIVLLASVAIFYGCQKKDNAIAAALTDLELTANATQNSFDNNRVEGDNETVGNDVLGKLESNPNFITLGPGDTLKNCDAFIDRSLWGTSAKTIVITYRDTLCNTGFIRSGVVTVQLVQGTNWYQANAILKISFVGLKVKPRLGNTYIYDGVRYITNVNGGLMFGYSPNAPVRDSVIHKIRATNTITFEDGTKRTWWIARKNAYSKNTFTLASSGDSTINGVNCSLGGSTRLNTNFVVQAPQTIVSKAACGWYNAQAGIRKVVSDNQTVTITFGVNASGSQLPLGLGCGDYYGYKIEWTKVNGTATSAVIAY
jgi:hypothetical protein